MKGSIIVHGGAGSGRYGEKDKRFAALAEAVEVGRRAMARGSGLDGAVAAVSFMEESGLFNCGRGACLTAEGRPELDAAVMVGDGLRGAGVGGVTSTYHPVKVARWVMEHTEHVLIVGEKTRGYARLAGAGVEDIRPSAASLARFAVLQRERKHLGAVDLAREIGGGTVGAVALGGDGVPAAAVSTGGTWMKLPGRVGDSAILGAGVFADSRSGAACSTGVGEEIIRVGLALRTAEFMRRCGAQEAAARGVAYITRERGEGTAGVITVDREGRVGAAYNTEAMGRAWWDPARGKVVVRV